MKLLRKNGQMPRTTTTSAMITVTGREKHFPRPLVNDAYALTAARQTVCQKVNATLRVQKLPLQMLRKVHRVVKILDVVVPRKTAL